MPFPSSYLAQCAYAGFHSAQGSRLEDPYAGCVQPGCHLVGHAGQGLGGESHGLLQCFSLVGLSTHTALVCSTGSLAVGWDDRCKEVKWELYSKYYRQMFEEVSIRTTSKKDSRH